MPDLLRAGLEGDSPVRRQAPSRGIDLTLKSIARDGAGAACVGFEGESQSMRRPGMWPRIWLGEPMRGLSLSPWGLGKTLGVWEGASGCGQIAEHRFRFCDHVATAGRFAGVQVSSKSLLSSAVFVEAFAPRVF